MKEIKKAGKKAKTFEIQRLVKRIKELKYVSLFLICEKGGLDLSLFLWFSGKGKTPPRIKARVLKKSKLSSRN